jgi:hypothetical protein
MRDKIREHDRKFAKIFHSDGTSKNGAKNSHLIKTIKREEKGAKIENISDFEKHFKEKLSSDSDHPNGVRNLMESNVRHSNDESDENVPVLKIPLNTKNILTLSLIVVLTIIGTVYIWILSTQKHCKCKLCKKEFIIDSSIAEGGFGAVYLVHKPISKAKFFQTRMSQITMNAKKEEAERRKEQYILKKLEMKDITDLD